MARLTVTDLIERKRQQADDDTLRIKAIKSDVLGGEILCEKLPLRQFAEMLDRAEENPSNVNTLELNQELIYKSCKLLQSKELQEAYGIDADRYDIVGAVFNDNFEEIGEVAEEIMKFYKNPMSVEAVKNS